jgi:hypothetical protein
LIGFFARELCIAVPSAILIDERPKAIWWPLERSFGSNA